MPPRGLVSLPIFRLSKTRVDLTLLTRTLEKVLRDFEKEPEWKDVLLSKPDFLGITVFQSDHMKVEITVKTEPHARADVSRELHRRIKLALEAAGIALPPESYLLATNLAK